MSNPINPPGRSDRSFDEPGETFESIPWESLQSTSRAGDNRTWYAAAGIIVAVGVALSVLRGLAPPSPVDIVSVSSTVPVVATTSTTVPASRATIVTEADLMALDPHTLERSAAAVAELAVADFFSAENEGLWSDVAFDMSKSTFVERVSALIVTPLAPERFSVTVVVSLLDGEADAPFVRRPLRAVAVVIESIDGRFRPVDLPTPVDLPIDRFDPPVVVPIPVDPEVLAAAAHAVSGFGVISGEPISYALLPSGVTRVVVPVSDDGGITWPQVVHVAADGSILPPG
jgi:hypothetical protein